MMSAVGQVVPDVRRALGPYPRISRYLSRLIRSRIGLGPIAGSALPSLIWDDDGSVLEDDPHSAGVLRNLEEALRKGENTCANFAGIFKGIRLPKDGTQADGKILDVLAEVKTVDYLVHSGFAGITRVIPASTARTTDFVARRLGIRYAVETTRVGLAQSPRKKPKPFVITPLMVGLDRVGTLPAYLATLADAVERKCRQIAGFIASVPDQHQGIVVVSLGWDFFVSQHARRDFFLKQTRQDALVQTWQAAVAQYPFLSHLVLVANPGSIVTFPPLPVVSQRKGLGVDV